MKKALSEIEILQQIDSLFGQLDQDSQKRIIDFISSKYKIYGGIKPFSNLGLSSSSKGEQLTPGTETHIKDFVASKKPETNYEKIACIAYYLEKVRSLESFKTIDITKGFQEARLPKLANPTVYVNDATKAYGYLSSVGTGSKALTPRGEAIVNALPDRDKVTQVLTELPHKRGNRKASKKN